MASERAFLDRVLRRAVPRPDVTYVPPPIRLGPDLWVLERRLRHIGLALLPTRTTIVRLADGSLVLIAPPAVIDAETVAAINRIGTVADVVVPNSFHYMYAAECKARFPDATLLAPPGMGQRVPDLAVDAELGARAPDRWAGELDHVVHGPMRGVCEVLFFHRASSTLILTDLAFNMTRYPRAVDRLFWRLSGIPRGFGPGRLCRKLLLSDREAVARMMEEVRDWPFERIVVAHGEVVERDAASCFVRVFGNASEA